MQKVGRAALLIALACGWTGWVAPGSCPAQTNAPADSKPEISLDSAKVVAAKSVSLISEKYRRGYDLCFVPRTTIDKDLPAWRLAAGANDSNGQLVLGLCNYYGIGGARNRDRGLEMIERAANSRNGEAMAVLSILIHNGDANTPPDLAEATRWLDRAVLAKSKIALDRAPIEKAIRHLIAEEHQDAYATLNQAAGKANLEAKFRLGKALRIGWAREVETERGTSLIKDAANAGHVGAMLEMADTFSNGRFIKPDKENWKKWLEAAIATGDAKGVLVAADLYENEQDSEPALGIRARVLVESMQKFKDPFTQFYIAKKLNSEYRKPEPQLDNLVFDRWIDAAERGVPESYLWANTIFFEGSPKHPKDLERARKLLEHGVAACDADAIHQMGCAYRFGYFEPADEKRSIEFFKTAASLGSPSAMSSIAMRFCEGRGLPYDPSLGLHCYLAGARAGAPDSMSSLAGMYCEGKFVEPNFEDCVFWSLQAIRNGQPDSYLTLSDLHFRGVGRPPSPERAIELLKEGVRSGSMKCRMVLAQRLIAGDGIPKDAKSGFYLIEQCLPGDAFGEARMVLAMNLLTAEGELANAKRAMDLLEESAGLGNARAHYRLANIYATGYGEITKDWDKALGHYEKAILLGDGEAMNELARQYLGGEVTPRDPQKAEALFLAGVAREDEKAMQMLIAFYLGQAGEEFKDLDKAFKAARLLAERGHFVGCHTIGAFCYDKQDYDAAREWYELGSKGNDGMCLNGMGILYRYGRGVEQNYETAFDYYRCAAEQNNLSAFMNLSWCYETGNGVKQDLAESFRYCNKAAQSGIGEAMLLLGKKYMDGTGIARDTKMGLFWIERSANTGNETAKGVLQAAKDKGLVK